MMFLKKLLYVLYLNALLNYQRLFQQLYNLGIILLWKIFAIYFCSNSPITKFRKLRLKDEKFLDLITNKTVEIALKNGIIEVKNKLIVDSTQTNARFQHIEDLLKRATEVRVEHKSADTNFFGEFSDSSYLKVLFNFCKIIIINWRKREFVIY